MILSDEFSSTNEKERIFMSIVIISTIFTFNIFTIFSNIFWKDSFKITFLYFILIIINSIYFIGKKRYIEINLYFKDFENKKIIFWGNIIILVYFLASIYCFINVIDIHN